MNQALFEEITRVRQEYLANIKPLLVSRRFSSANAQYGIVSCFINSNLELIREYSHGKLFLARAETFDRALGDAAVDTSGRRINLELEINYFEESFAQLQLAIQTDNTGDVK